MSPALTAISVDVPVTDFDVMDNWKGRSGKFIKGFLLNDKRNKNGWMVPWNVIKKYASDFVVLVSVGPLLFLSGFQLVDHQMPL